MEMTGFISGYAGGGKCSRQLCKCSRRVEVVRGLEEERSKSSRKDFLELFKLAGFGVLLTGFPKDVSAEGDETGADYCKNCSGKVGYLSAFCFSLV
mmetsp:Transcript_18511/g.74402  ORF Transcript_18511/g.74402 Transcript_18511/m.74402 type:complete len:96 (-) Transcript_18511:2415-2702(-)